MGGFLPVEMLREISNKLPGSNPPAAVQALSHEEWKVSQRTAQWWGKALGVLLRETTMVKGKPFLRPAISGRWGWRGSRLSRHMILSPALLVKWRIQKYYYLISWMGSLASFLHLKTAVLKKEVYSRLLKELYNYMSSKAHIFGYPFNKFLVSIRPFETFQR